MFKKSYLMVLAGAIACSCLLSAQTANPADPTATDPKKSGESPGPQRFWQANVPSGSFMVALDRIVSVSRAKYLLDGAVIVDEVTVDTAGQALARFYFLTPVTDAMQSNALTGIANRGRELIDKAGDRAGTEVQDMVQKKYPLTTHAKCIEYRMLSEQSLSALYASARNAWETGRGRQFTAK